MRGSDDSHKMGVPRLDTNANCDTDAQGWTRNANTLYKNLMQSVSLADFSLSSNLHNRDDCRHLRSANMGGWNMHMLFISHHKFSLIVRTQCQLDIMLEW